VITAMWLEDQQLSALEWCGAALLVTGAVLEARG
jgi:drug/metabolite transporter (DMT)-like permease